MKVVKIDKEATCLFKELTAMKHDALERHSKAFMDIEQIDRRFGELQKALSVKYGAANGSLGSIDDSGEYFIFYAQ